MLRFLSAQARDPLDPAPMLILADRLEEAESVRVGELAWLPPSSRPDWFLATRCRRASAEGMDA